MTTEHISRDYRAINQEMREAFDGWAEDLVREQGALARDTARDFVGFLAGYRIARERYARSTTDGEVSE